MRFASQSPEQIVRFVGILNETYTRSVVPLIWVR